MINKELLARLKDLPNEPGVYLWKDANDNILYVGKAKNLRKRTTQYFSGSLNSYKTAAMISNIYDIEVILVNNNKEALLLEKQLIEKFNPPYNILLLDDKRYPYIKVELLSHNLSVSLVRKIQKKSNPYVFYFGPFPNGYGANVILKMIQREVFFENGLPVKNKDIEYWKKSYEHIINLLKFADKNYIKELENKMYEASESMQFEIALDLRNIITYIKKMKEQQVIELTTEKNVDVLAFINRQNVLYISILFYRYGNLINIDHQKIEYTNDWTETLEKFIDKYYTKKIIPDYLIMGNELDTENFNLSDSLKLVYPKQGKYKKILDIAKKNNQEFFKTSQTDFKNNQYNNLFLIDSLQKLLNVQKLKNIIVFDNSHLANTNPVGVAIWIENGLFNKSKYKKFNLSSAQTRHADVEYMRQNVTKYIQNNLIDNVDLFVVDGSKQQINEVKKVLKEFNVKIHVIGLIKDDKHKTKSLVNIENKEINIDDQNLFNFLSAIQIEVDRFAKSHYRKRHKITSLEGKLTSIKGVGPKMESKLIKHFITYSNIYNASVEELSKVVPYKIALLIKNEVK
ncbi:excinuclease ABC subunit UvrC [Mycoplasma phocoenae]|uniref:Excinuclease ABC subunit UvrC n=1 Tax=Mycoplasma phocoenae TaxID=754517 RepID=A0A858U7G9_9MOLU|nr:excinuclease ABC subunit UvrC [Mycoplasma phocoenae]QJG66728.1 excinuclease ABC subunit UvrC [Mycoplasma phocoenae]